MLMEPKELPSGGQVAASAGPQVLLERLFFPGTARPWGPGDQDLGRGTPTPGLGWETTCLGSSRDGGHGWMPVVPEQRVDLEEKPEADAGWALVAVSGGRATQGSPQGLGQGWQREQRLWLVPGLWRPC